jgi:hypothetical protein
MYLNRNGYQHRHRNCNGYHHVHANHTLHHHSDHHHDDHGYTDRPHHNNHNNHTNLHMDPECGGGDDCDRNLHHHLGNNQNRDNRKKHQNSEYLHNYGNHQYYDKDRTINRDRNSYNTYNIHHKNIYGLYMVHYHDINDKRYLHGDENNVANKNCHSQLTTTSSTTNNHVYNPSHDNDDNNHSHDNDHVYDNDDNNHNIRYRNGDYHSNNLYQHSMYCEYLVRDNPNDYIYNIRYYY